jgi:serine/threonine-protein kinase
VRSNWSVRTKAIASGAWIVVLLAAGINGQMQSNPQPVATGPQTVASASPSPITSPATVAAHSPGQQPTPTVVSPTPVAVVQPVVAPPVVAPPVVAPPAVDPYAAATAARASAVCADGTWSYSQHRSGTCSGHGGVHWWTGNLGPAGPGAH